MIQDPIYEKRRHIVPSASSSAPPPVAAQGLVEAEREIPRELASLYQEADELKSLIDRLRTQLGPVLRSDPLGEGRSQAVGPVCSPIGGQVWNIRTLIAECDRNVRDLLDSVQV